MKIKIIYFLSSDSLNGTEKVALQLASKINKVEFDVSFALPIEKNIAKKLRELNIPYIKYESKKIGYDKFSIKYSYILRFRKYLINNNFHFLHSQDSTIPGLIVKNSKVISIETRHGLFYQSSELKKLGLKRKIIENFKKYFLDYTTTVCEYDRQNLIKYFGFSPDKVKTIYNGINVNYFDKFLEMKSDFNNKNYFVIGNIGRLSRQKNQYELLLLFKLLKQRINKIKLVIIGEGELKAEIENNIVLLELKNDVTLKNYTTEIVDEIIKFDLLLMTSIYEGVPLVILESMALKVPVASSSVGGIPEVISDKINGLLINDLNLENDINKLVKYINDRNLLNKLALNAKNNLSNFSENKMISEYESFYKKILNKFN